ncbi:MAG: hypothetical protein NC311_03710 [Muribaculaceae bacterium]|nr:hypothetical protein [Muribaculaceae bacterium]
MNKLTAGIFAGILTIVGVNAADAAITSKAYVDGLIEGVEANVATNTTDITNLTKTVAGNKTAAEDSIKELKETVDGLAGDGTGSVAEQIAGALGEIPEGSTVSVELGKKQDKSTADYMMGTAAGDWKALTDVEKGALQSGITATGVAQIMTNKNDIATNAAAIEANADAISAMDTAYKAADAAIDTKIGTLPEGTTSVVQMITNVQSNAADSVDEKLDKYSTTEQMNTALDGKQDTLGATNVATAGTGNAVVSVSAADGKVTATLGTVMPAVPADQTLTDGTLVLTAKIVDGTTTYGWESIER